VALAITLLGPGSGAALVVVVDVRVELVYSIAVASTAPATLAELRDAPPPSGRLGPPSSP